MKFYYTNIKDDAKTKLAFIALMVIITLMGNKYSLRSGDVNSIVSTVALALTSAFTLLAYIKIDKNPVEMVIYIFLTQLITYIKYIIISDTITEATEITGVEFGISLIAFIIWLTKDLKKNKTIKEIVSTEKRLYKVKLVYSIIIWGIVITALGVLAKSDMMNTLGNNSWFRLYGAIAFVFPTLILIALVTYTTLAKQFIVVYNIMEWITLVLMFKYGLDSGTESIYLTLETIIVLRVCTRNIKRIKGEKSIEKEKQI